MKRVFVKWRDSRLYLTQISQDDLTDVAIIESIGFLVEEKEDSYVIAGDLLDEDMRRVIVIPRENIVNFNVLK